MAANEVNGMQCSEFKKDVDALARGELPDIAKQAMEEHAASCEDCAANLATAKFIARQTAKDRAPEPDADYESRILGRALAGSSPSATKHWKTPAWIGAVAAALVVGVFLGGKWNQPEQDVLSAQTVAEGSQPPAITQKTVRLAFTSTDAVENVTLTLELPPNLELTPFPGRHKVSWKVSLKPGDNLLALPVNVLFPGQGSLVAHLGEGEKRKTFRTDIGKLTEPSS
ncbi:zf-HC2 domain-containing protein [Marinobacter sp. MIT932201]|uniref:zf-HC2 domain-containing protein n=1 Tax=Marinobacter sp. MIT932201 TaxID=3096995 RepID=UPI003999BFF5